MTPPKEPQRYGQFTYWVDSDGLTVIGDSDYNKITRFIRTLSEDQIAIWVDGYATGELRGINKGRIEKAAEIRSVLFI